MKTVGLLSLGCKVNTYEMEYIKGELEKHNYKILDFSDKCDIYIINTCTVTNTSDTKSNKMIRKARRENPDACIVAMGCFIESSKDTKFDDIDIVIGNKDKNKIIELLDEYFDKKKTIIKLYSDFDSEFEDMYIEDFPGRTRAFVKIQDGCENFCSYCIIPYVRGKCRSKNNKTVIDEIKALIKNGYKEVVLTGIHTGNYKYKDIDFGDLLSEIVKIDGLERLRISSIEVTELNDRVLELIKNNSVIVDHMHIPLQAGSDEILKLMNRKYNLEYFENKIKEIRSIRPNISITTDVIVGFNGETDELFNKTIDTCRRIGFSKIHVFPYSERKGTKAMELDGVVPIEERKKRSRELLKVSKELEIDYMNKFINKELDVLIETNKDGFSIGHTSNYLNVKIKGVLEHNTFVKVKIISIDYPYVIGEV